MSSIPRKTRAAVSLPALLVVLALTALAGPVPAEEGELREAGELREEGYNASSGTDAPPYVRRAEGTHGAGVPADGEARVVVYSDDVLFRRDYVVQALDRLGMSYTLYWKDPRGFEQAVRTESWDIILVNQDAHYGVSRAWDDVLAAYFGGTSVAVATFDAGGAHDPSGMIASLYQALGATGVTADKPQPDAIYPWKLDHYIIAGPALRSPGVMDTPDLSDNGYIDDGDALSVADPRAAIQGWSPGFDSGQAATVVNPGVCQGVFLSWLPDNYLDDDDRNGVPDPVQLWMNIIRCFAVGPTATEQATWGSLKVLYR